MSTLRIGSLLAGGIVVGYRCPSRCRHCLYGAGPHRRDGGGTPADLERVLDLLAERAPRARYHVGGGEPFRDLELLRRVVSGMTKRGLVLEYVETNAFWARDQGHAEEVLSELADEGLPCVLVSLSPFHAEWVPVERTLAVVEAARRSLPAGAFVWISDFLPDLRAAGGGTLDLDALLGARGDGYARGLADRYGLVPAGRAGRYLHAHGARRPWEEVAAGAPCRRRLSDTSHFHVDLHGQYVPGLCAGIVLPLEAVPGEVDLGRYPVLEALVDGGPTALVDLARERGFVPAATYASACDLCGHARLALADAELAELGPPGFYDVRSVPGYEPTEP